MPQSHQVLPPPPPPPPLSITSSDHECCSLRSWAASSDDSPASSQPHSGPECISITDRVKERLSSVPGLFKDANAEVELEDALWSDVTPGKGAASYSMRFRLSKLLDQGTTDYARALKKDATGTRDLTMWETILHAAAWTGVNVAESTGVYTPKVSPSCPSVANHASIQN